MRTRALGLVLVTVALALAALAPPAEAQRGLGRNRSGQPEAPAGVGKARAVGLHAVTPGIEIAASKDVLRPEHGDQVVAGDPGGAWVHVEHDVLEVAALPLVVVEQGDAGEARQGIAVGVKILAVHRYDLVQRLKAGQSRGGR